MRFTCFTTSFYTLFNVIRRCLIQHKSTQKALLYKDFPHIAALFVLVETAELESATPCMSSKYSNQLSYASVTRTYDITIPLFCQVFFTGKIICLSQCLSQEKDFVDNSALFRYNIYCRRVWRNWQTRKI